jgi:hypothetical protein
VSNLLVGLDDGDESARAAVEHLIAGREPALAVTPWSARAPFYRQVRDLYLGIFEFRQRRRARRWRPRTPLMTVFERMRELGTLRAIGTTPGRSLRCRSGALARAAGRRLGARGRARRRRPRAAHAASARRRRPDRPAPGAVPEARRPSR